MGFFSFLRSTYNVDTLDTRFTTPSSVPYRADGVTKRELRPDSRAQPSRWNTGEFYLYYLVFLVAIPTMFWIPYEVSKRG